MSVGVFVSIGFDFCVCWIFLFLGFVFMKRNIVTFFNLNLIQCVYACVFVYLFVSLFLSVPCMFLCKFLCGCVLFSVCICSTAVITSFSSCFLYLLVLIQIACFFFKFS